MKSLIPLFFFLLLLSLSCRSDHSRKQQEIQQLMDACTNADADTIVSLPRAIYLTEYMEAEGSAADRQHAWRMLAKVYRQHLQPAFELRALWMAIACIDTCHDFDTLEMARCYFDLSTCLHNSSGYQEALIMSHKAERLANMAHDTILSHICMGESAWPYGQMAQLQMYLQVSDSAYRYLWAHGARADAVDARLPYIFYFIDTNLADSAFQWLEEYRRLTHRNLESPRSRDAIFLWRLKGNYWQAKGRPDSAAFYYRKMLQPGSPNNEAMAVGYRSLARLFAENKNADSAYAYYEKARESQEKGLYFNLQNSMEAAKNEYQQQREYMEQEQRSQRIRQCLLTGLTALGFLIILGVYRYTFLRRRYRETLAANSEYAAMLQQLKQQSLPQLVSTAIAQRFHELSSQDAHPSASEWQALYSQIATLYPTFFPTLTSSYGEQQPEQTLSEQEQRVVCLIAIRCSPLQMSVLMVCGKSNISNLRRRLYRKLTGKEGSGADLDRLVIKLCS